MKTLTHPSLLVVDEIARLPVSRSGAMHFFQLMSRPYEHASSNKSFEEWGENFGDFSPLAEMPRGPGGTFLYDTNGMQNHTRTAKAIRIQAPPAPVAARFWSEV
jgi:hypothetical protein